MILRLIPGELLPRIVSGASILITGAAERLFASERLVSGAAERLFLGASERLALGAA